MQLLLQLCSWSDHLAGEKAGPAASSQRRRTRLTRHVTSCNKAQGLKAARRSRPIDATTPVSLSYSRPHSITALPHALCASGVVALSTLLHPARKDVARTHCGFGSLYLCAQPACKACVASYAGVSYGAGRRRLLRSKNEMTIEAFQAHTRDGVGNARTIQRHWAGTCDTYTVRTTVHERPPSNRTGCIPPQPLPASIATPAASPGITHGQGAMQPCRHCHTARRLPAARTTTDLRAGLGTRLELRSGQLVRNLAICSFPDLLGRAERSVRWLLLFNVAIA